MMSSLILLVALATSHLFSTPNITFSKAIAHRTPFNFVPGAVFPQVRSHFSCADLKTPWACVPLGHNESNVISRPRESIFPSSPTRLWSRRAVQRGVLHSHVPITKGRD
ncbi:hypothetical protein B0H19DRAFT_604492 [Mycena capillaripes]|nr:hypothetical protein B0H19DRAFT_604492 [Mycena capillaripes]